MPSLKESLLDQLNAAKTAYGAINPNNIAVATNEFASLAVSAIERATGVDSSRSVTARDAAKIIAMLSARDPLALSRREALLGIVNSVIFDVEHGYLDEARTLIHAEVFGDLLEQAEYLLSEGYKDPAAVMCGGVLESHLRNLCVKNGVDVNEPDGKPKKAGKMNEDLVKAKVYTVLQQKEVTAWLGFRNSAAHGKFGEYDANQIKTMIDGVRGFINRYPA